MQWWPEINEEFLMTEFYIFQIRYRMSVMCYKIILKHMCQNLASNYTRTIIIRKNILSLDYIK